VFRRIFTMLGIDTRILMAIVDWIDADQNPNVTPPGGAAVLFRSHAATDRAQRSLLTLRELLLVRGVTPILLARLEGFVTVLPLIACG